MKQDFRFSDLDSCISDAFALTSEELGFVVLAFVILLKRERGEAEGLREVGRRFDCVRSFGG